MTAARIELIPVTGMPEVATGDHLGELIVAAVHSSGEYLRAGDVVVVAQKVVSKAEGAVRDLNEVAPGSRAEELATRLGANAALVQCVLDESARVVRDERVLIVETHHGFICANAGIDQSNVPGDRMVTLLPRDPDASAAELARHLQEATGTQVGVIVSDTFGRPWRTGIVNVALGVAQAPAQLDYRGAVDDFGRELHATVIAVADELAAAAGLVMGKTNRVPAVIVRGVRAGSEPGSGRELLRSAREDLFR